MLGRKERIAEIDLIRALAILGVVIVHTTASAVATLTPGSQIYPIYNFLNIACKYGTPAFIFISSFVLFYNYGDRPFGRERIGVFYKRRLFYIVIPYVVFSALYCSVKAFDFGGFSGWVSLFRSFASQLLTGTAHAHLYFVFVNMQFYLAFPFLLRALQKNARLANGSIWVGFAVQWGFVLANAYLFRYQDKGSIALSYASCYFLGTYAGLHYERFRTLLAVTRDKLKSKYALFWCALWAVWLSGACAHAYVWYLARVYAVHYDALLYEWLWNVHTSASVLVLFQAAVWFAERLPGRAAGALNSLGRCSFGVYLMHPLVLIYFEKYFHSGAPVVFHLLNAAKLACALFIPWLFTSWASDRLKWSWMLFGSNAVSRKGERKKRRVTSC